jgi:pimeloyl-ACP methyl ester carboxylesterase
VTTIRIGNRLGWGRVIDAALVGAFLSACTVPNGPSSGLSSSPQATESPAPTATADAGEQVCIDALALATHIKAVGARAFVLGEGSRGVVFSNQSDMDLCSWLPFAREIASAGFAVLLYDYSSRAQRQQNVVDAAIELRRRGTRDIFLVGASVGAINSLDAATEIDPLVAGVVTLSAEYASYPELLRVPVLFVTSEDDGYVSLSTARSIYERTASRHKQLEIIDGDQHGTDILSGPAVGRVKGLILAFLRAPALAVTRAPSRYERNA